MAPQIAPVRQQAPAGRPATPRPQELLERLRDAVGPAGTRIADGLVEAIRQELKREYERGYHDGWASFRNPVDDGGSGSFRRKLRRRARRGLRHWFTGPHSVQYYLLRLLLIVGVCAGAVTLSLTLSQASKGKKLAPPTITW